MAKYGVFCGVLSLLFIVCAGCASLAVGDVSLSQDNLSVHITNPGEPVDAGVQVRVSRIQDMVQKEVANTVVSAKLARGENAVSIPLRLDPGTYKLWVYIIINNERNTATIKDLVV